VADLVDVFLQSHDPTTPNQDGANYGPEYHSTIFFEGDDQRQVVTAALSAAQDRHARPIVTTVKPYSTFAIAEEDHQDFYNQNPNSGYCRVIIQPKLRRLGLE